MRCPFCGHDDTSVKDTRPGEDNREIRRRRYCSSCSTRFTTSERVHLRDLTVLKKTGQKQNFEHEKLARSVFTAVRKRNIEPEKMERVISSIVRRLEMLGEVEIPSSLIGEYVLEVLLDLDPVAYIRFASVYRDFQSVEDFRNFIGKLNVTHGH